MVFKKIQHAHDDDLMKSRAGVVPQTTPGKSHKPAGHHGDAVTAPVRNGSCRETFPVSQRRSPNVHSALPLVIRCLDGMAWTFWSSWKLPSMSQPSFSFSVQQLSSTGSSGSRRRCFFFRLLLSLFSLFRDHVSPKKNVPTT